jgi:uncharacterized membrane protein YphA (DoxX/SURF4 family)
MKYSTQIDLKKLFITIIRIAIGWHFLYEGLTKVFIENWSAYSYLANTSGFLSGFYHWLIVSPVLMKIIDILNIYGLILIGVALFIGLLIRYAAMAGAVLLTLYYFAYPPFGVSLYQISEGHQFIVDKIFIEAFILLFFALYRDMGYGIDSLKGLLRKDKKETEAKSENESQTAKVYTRREVLKNLAPLPILGIMGWGAIRNSQKYDIDVTSGATVQIKRLALGELKGVLPKGKIGNHEITRLVFGGNLIGGGMHARDLFYVGSLCRAYNTEKKIYETLILAEESGINTINIGFPSNPLMSKYKKMTGSKIKVISQVGMNKAGDYFGQISQAIDYGADILQINGGVNDHLVRDNKIDVIERMLNMIKSQGFTAGMGAHTIDTLIICEGKGIIPDYYMQTMHHDKYWSATPRENRVAFEADGEKSPDHNKWHDNIFCPFPERTVEFVNRTKVPVMGFKVLAAGAIKPEDGIKWAFENGADFVCVGMFDYQIVNDVNICMDTLNNLNKRQREWYG